MLESYGQQELNCHEVCIYDQMVLGSNPLLPYAVKLKEKCWKISRTKK